MRPRILFLLSFLLVATLMMAQSIKQHEYWIDSNYSNRQSVTSSNTSVSLKASTVGLTSGIHFLNFRALNSDDEWGTLSRTLFYIPERASETSPVDEYEYWLDDEVANRETGSGAKDVYVLTIDVSKLTDGDHAFYFRAKNADGEWGTVYTESFEIDGNAATNLLTFVDPAVGDVCIQNWDTDKDGYLSKDEASAVTSLGTVFKGTEITSFNELKYFTGLTKIDNNAFAECAKLESVELPNTITEIGAGAFCKTKLTSISIPDEVITIGNEAFWHNSLKKCILSSDSKLKTIGYDAFRNSSLETINIPKYVESVNAGAFSLCYNLQSITVDNENGYFKSYSDDKVLMKIKEDGNEIKRIVAACNNASIPDDVEEIGQNSFEGVYAFAEALGKVKVENLVLPEGLKVILPNAFSACRDLVSVELPSTLTRIDDGAFNNDDNITSVIVKAKEPFTIAENTFSSIANVTLYVPAGCKAAYQAADVWKGFKEIVESEDGEVFTAKTIEGVEMTFQVISKADKTCQVGVSGKEEICFDSNYNGQLTIPAKANGYDVISIAPFACSGSRVTSIIVSEGIKTIEDRAFGFNGSMESITLPEGLETIGSNIVWSCGSLKSFHVPSTVTEMHTTFGWCDALEEITVAEGNEVFDSRNNCNAIIKTKTNELLAGCKNTVIPNTVEILAASSFSFLKSLTEITIPEGVKVMRNQIFAKTSLKSITIPSTMTTIGSFSFDGCEDLTEVTIKCAKPFVIKDDVFTDVAYGGVLNVPFGTKSLYEGTDGWKNFKNIVEMEDSDDDLNTVLTLEAVEDGTTITISNPLKLTIGYSLDGGNNWNTSDAESITISGFAAGTKVCLHGDNDQYSDLNNYTTINCDKDCYLYGNIMSLISSTDFAKITELTKESTFAYLFSENTHIKNHPSKNIVLPATTLSDYCYALLFYNCTSLTRPAVLPATSIPNGAYYGLFSGCSSLKEAPALPATVLDEYSYAWMFENCTSLTTAPALPASSVPEWAYRSMFLNCTNLTETPSLPATTIAKGSYAWMFESCESLTKAPEILPASVAADSCYYAMFAVCKSLTTAPKLPATKLGESCYAWMFNECEALVSAPDLPATEMADSCYIGMFRCCDALTTAPKLPATKLAHNCYAAMFFHSGLKEVPELPAVNLAERCYGYMFSQCPNITSAVLPAAKLEKDCYEAMFQYCENLNSVTCMATDISAEGCCRIWLDGVAETGTFTKPNSMTAWETGVSGIPESWTIDNMKENTEAISISKALQVTYMSDKNLDFTGYPDLKAYVATGYDKSSGTIWLTRVKYVPANTGILLMGEAGDYEIPVKKGESTSYYMNLFKGTIEGTTIQTTDGDNTNYYLSKGDAGVGFYKVQGSVELKPNRAYLSVPTEIPVVGATGSTETIKVSAAGQVPYYNSQSLDFSSLDAQGVKAYTATGYDYTSGTIWLTRVKQVPAETGILIMAPQGEYPVPTASVASVYANMFKGTLTGTTIQTHETIADEDYINYYLSSGESGVGFYKVTKEGGVTIGANRCYLPIKNKDAAAGTRSASSDPNQIAIEEADEVIGIPLLRGIGGDEDGTTGVKEVKSGEVKGEKWYTLQGQRVAKPGKGLYIRNGKKVVIK